MADAPATAVVAKPLDIDAELKEAQKAEHDAMEKLHVASVRCRKAEAAVAERDKAKADAEAKAAAEAK